MLAERDFPMELYRPIVFEANIEGSQIRAVVDGISIEADDDGDRSFSGGGMGLFVCEGAMSTDHIEIGAVSR